MTTIENFGPSFFPEVPPMITRRVEADQYHQSYLDWMKVTINLIEEANLQGVYIQYGDSDIIR